MSSNSDAIRYTTKQSGVQFETEIVPPTLLFRLLSCGIAKALGENKTAFQISILLYSSYFSDSSNVRCVEPSSKVVPIFGILFISCRLLHFLSMILLMYSPPFFPRSYSSSFSRDKNREWRRTHNEELHSFIIHLIQSWLLNLEDYDRQVMQPEQKKVGVLSTF